MSWLVSVIVAGLLTIGASDLPTISQASEQRSNETSKVQTPPNSLVAQSGTQEKIDQTYPLNSNGRVSLNNINGAVMVEAWDRNEIRLEAVKTIDCERPFNINVKIDSNPNYFQVETEYPKNETWINNGSKNSKSYSYGYGNRCREARVDYQITVPRTARLDEIETVNGAITLGGTTDFVKASTVNGRIVATNLRGSVNLSSVNGALDVDFDSLGNVRDVKIGMVNGAINLTLPSDVEATVKADTVNGAINNDFGLPVRKGEYVGRNLYGRIGNGNIAVQLNGVNGTINVRRKQDGRSPKPVINLLPPQGNSLNDEDDDDESAFVRPPKPPRTPKVPPVAPIVDGTTEIIDETVREQIRQALKESNKVTKQALKEAAKVKIDKEEISRQIREGLEQAEKEIAQMRNFAFFERDFNWSNGAAAAAMWNPMRERETKSIAVDNTPNVVINARGGAISIRGWDKAEVSYSLLKNSDAATASLEKKNAEISLNVTNNGASFRLEVYVPRQSNVRVETDRSIRIENVKGNIRLSGDDAIDVRDANGSLSIRGGNGKVRIIGFTGDTEIKTLSGDIALEGDFSSVDTDTETGNTFLTLSDEAAAQLEASTQNPAQNGVTTINTTAKTGNYSFAFSGVKNQPDRSYSFKTDSGKILVRRTSSVRIG